MTRMEKTLASSAEVLDYWFGTISHEQPFDMQSVQMQRWYGKSSEIDAEIRRRFEPLYESLRQTQVSVDDSERSVEEALANLIVLDQFPRNMYRDTPRMYESDTLALDLAQWIHGTAAFDKLDLFRQLFTMVPFMHAEDAEAQRVVVGQFEKLRDRVRDAGLPNSTFFDQALDFAYRHAEIVNRFGRFPHRNAILGRKSTAEEVEFLKLPGSGF